MDDVRDRIPPLGVIPKVLWYEQRIHDLSRAIADYVRFGDYEQAYWWACEMVSTMRCRERHLEEIRPGTASAEAGNNMQQTNGASLCVGCLHNQVCRYACEEPQRECGFRVQS